MKSSRLSPAGRLQGGACILGSRSEGCGCASSSSARPLWKEGGRGSPAGPAAVPSGLDPRVGKRGRLWEGVRASWWELQDPGNRLLRAPACRLPVPAPRGTMGCLLGWAAALGGSGGGEAGQERAFGTKLLAGLWASPSGALTTQAAHSPRGRQRERGSWQRPRHEGLSVPPASPRPCVRICSPAGTGLPQAGRGLAPQQGQPPTAQQGHGGARGGISRQQEPLLSSKENPLACLASLA